MTDQELQRITDTFHVGKIVEWNKYSNSLFSIKTNQGVFLIGALTFNQWLEIEKENTETGLRQKFPELPLIASLVFTQETYADDSNLPVPFTHKYELYWFCLRL